MAQMLLYFRAETHELLRTMDHGYQLDPEHSREALILQNRFTGGKSLGFFIPHIFKLCLAVDLRHGTLRLTDSSFSSGRQGPGQIWKNAYGTATSFAPEFRSGG
jgi:hypothetical protein